MLLGDILYTERLYSCLNFMQMGLEIVQKFYTKVELRLFIKL